MSRILVALVFATACYGQNWVEERTLVSGGVVTPRVNGMLTRPVKGRWGSFVWFQTQAGYSESYIGGTFSPKPWMQLALGGGLEQDKHPGRIGSFAWLGNKRNSVLFIAEDGGSGFWHKVEALHTFNCSFEAGFLQERYKGSGPELKFRLPHLPVAIWAAPMTGRNPQTRRFRVNTLVGIRWSL